MKREDLLLKGISDDCAVADDILLVFCEQARNAKVVLEFGTRYGRTALNFANMAPADAIVYTIDIKRWNWNPLKKWPEAFNKIRFLTGDSRTFDFFGHGITHADVILVDGRHDYGTVISDTRMALQLACPNGLIFWHDYGPNLVNQAPLLISDRQEVYQALKDMEIPVKVTPGYNCGGTGYLFIRNGVIDERLTL